MTSSAAPKKVGRPPKRTPAQKAQVDAMNLRRSLQTAVPDSAAPRLADDSRSPSAERSATGTRTVVSPAPLLPRPIIAGGARGSSSPQASTGAASAPPLLPDPLVLDYSHSTFVYGVELSAPAPAGPRVDAAAEPHRTGGQGSSLRRPAASSSTGAREPQSQDRSSSASRLRCRGSVFSRRLEAFLDLLGS